MIGERHRIVMLNHMIHEWLNAVGKHRLKFSPVSQSMHVRVGAAGGGYSGAVTRNNMLP